jgi:hypothetical protein
MRIGVLVQWENCVCVDLEIGCDEWLTVSSKFHASLPSSSYTIAKITRIQVC